MTTIFDVLAKFGIQPVAADIDAKVQALVAAHQQWQARRRAALGG